MRSVAPSCCHPHAQIHLTCNPATWLQALLRHHRLAGLDARQCEPASTAVLSLFEDYPNSVLHPFSLHSLCDIGASAGVVAGRWLGPWVLCHALQKLAKAANAAARRPVVEHGNVVSCSACSDPDHPLHGNEVGELGAAEGIEPPQADLSSSMMEQASDIGGRVLDYGGRAWDSLVKTLQPTSDPSSESQPRAAQEPSAADDTGAQDSKCSPASTRPASMTLGELVEGFDIYVMCDPGGGAPTFDAEYVQCCFSGTGELAGALSPEGSLGAQDPGDAEDPHHLCAAVPLSELPDTADMSSRPAVDQSQTDTTAAPPAVKTLLILVPLTLGVGAVDSRYLAQLKRLLGFPQTVGIVGGRPGSSLYFVGCQDDNFIYLDPHECQAVSNLPHSGAETYFCSGPKLMPMSAIDPSLAIGLCLTSPAEVQDLRQRLADMEREFRSTPLVTVAGNLAPQRQGSAAAADPLRSQAGPSQPSQADRADAGDWEVV